MAASGCALRLGAPTRVLIPRPPRHARDEPAPTLLRDVRLVRAVADDPDERDEAEELYGDYVDAVETGTEILADMRWEYIRTLDEEAAEEYEAEFNRAVAKRLPTFGLEIENR